MGPQLRFLRDLFELQRSRRRDAEVDIRAVFSHDMWPLAQLCTDCFYGEHTLQDGPVIFMQRVAALVKILLQVRTRIGYEDDRECKMLLAMAEQELCGCVDLAVHLYDKRERKMNLLQKARRPPRD